MPIPKFPGHEKGRLTKLEEQRLVRKHIAEEESLKNDEESTWQFGRELGKGSFGRVVEAMLSRTGEMHAIKQIHMKPNSKREYQLAVQEIDLMRKLRHPHIVSVKGAFIDEEDDVFNIVMELVPGRSLDDMRQVMGAFHENVVRRFTRQILLALDYCHKNGCVHRDVKGKNVLMGVDGLVRLADFGSAAVLNDRLIKDAVSGNYSYTPLWVAPEAVAAGQYSEKVDIWALGCVVIEMASGKDPWSEKGFVTPYQAITYIGTKDEIPLIPATLSSLGHDFCRRCLTRNPDLRPSAAELLKHPFVNAALGEEVASPPPSAPSPTHSMLQPVLSDTSPTLLLDNLQQLGGAARQQLQRMSDMVDTKAGAHARSAAHHDGDIPPPPPYPFVNSTAADAMAPLHSAKAGAPREGAAACSSSSDESTRSVSRVFRYSHAGGGDSDADSHAYSVKSDMSLSSSVLSFVDGYNGLHLDDREPGARAPQ